MKIKWKFVLVSVAMLTAAVNFIQPARALETSKTLEATAGKVAAPLALTLSECIDTALQNNPNLRAVRAEADVAAAERKIAEGARWPSVGVKGGASRYLGEQRLTPARYNGEKGVFGKNMVDIGLSLRMPLFTGGRIINTIRAAELTEKEFLDRFARSRQELIFNVTSAFFTILGRRSQLESIVFSRDVLKKGRRRIENLIEAKKAARVDLLRIDVRLAQVEQSRVQVRNDIHVVWRVLYNLMGIQTEFGELMPNLEGDLDPMPLMPNVENSFELALKQRPDFQAARARVDAQDRRVDVARGERWLQVKLEGSYGYRFATDPSEHPEGTNDAEDQGTIGLTMEIPVFEGGRIQARIRREGEQLSALGEKLISLRLGIQKEVETAIFNMQSALQRVNTQKAAIAQAKEALRIEQEKYRFGKGTILDVLDSQRALLEIETEYYRALAEYHIAIGQFRLATGEIS